MSQLGTGMRGFLRKLARDRAGNTLAIVAGTTIPLLAMIGGGVDISRGYMAKTQLQAACDAGVLAGRRAMAKSGEYTAKERAKADAMFNFNFNKASVQADGKKTTFTTKDNDEGQVLGTATTEMPTSVMYVFGKDEIDLNVECMAELQLANVDVMFVLDTTGSMAGTKISGLRDAVRDFHSTVAQAVVDDDTRVRYAFVPYSTSVNASQLITKWGMPTNNFVDSAPYQSRVAVFDTADSPATDVETVIESVQQTYNNGQTISNTNCTNYGNNNYPSSGSNPEIVSGTSPAMTTQYKYSRVTATYSGNKSCVRLRQKTTKTYWVPHKFTRWEYRQVSLNTSSFKAFSSSSLATSTPPSAARAPQGSYNMQQLAAMNDVAGTRVTGVTGITSSTWNGCLEERSTIAASSYNPIPDEALDLNLNLPPSNDSSRWKPIWAAASYYRDPGVAVSTSGTKSSAPCPSPMLLFQEIETNSTSVPDWLDTYLDGLVATGNTYHDIGMIWGGRLASPHGIFQSNVNEGDAESISRHLIFMTDGVMEPNRTVYTAYGVEQSDNRIGPAGFSNTQLAARHTLRFRAICDAIKAEGYTIYVVGFGTSLTADLKYCSSGGRAYQSNNTTELRNTFKFIASQVADLRLGK